MEHVTRKYFTFGPDQGSALVPDPSRDWAVVSAHRGHRALFMAWLGSNNFSSEYSEEDFREYRGKYGANNTPVADITVLEHRPADH